MRILALVTDSFGGTGGIARYNQYFLSALARRNDIERIIVIGRNHSASNQDIPSKILIKKTSQSKWGYALCALKTVLAERPFQLIFCGHLNLIWLTAVLAKIARVSYWLQLYGIEAWYPKSVYFSPLKKAALVTALSRHTRERFIHWSHIQPARVKILPSPYDQRFKPGTKPAYLLKRYEAENRKILLTLSRLSSDERYKGHERVIKIVPQLLQVYSNLVYFIGGEGDDRERLNEIVMKLGLQEKVKFIGPIAENELADHYRMADLFVMPSTGEGFGIVFLEAAACGIPIVAGNQDGSVDALLEGKLGFLVDPNNSDQLERAICQGLSQARTDHEMVERFSYANYSEHVNRLIESLTHAS